MRMTLSATGAAAGLLALLASGSASAQIKRMDPALDALVAPDAKIEKLAGGFGFIEGPVELKDGSVLFSDIPNNSIMKWSPDGKVALYRKPSGYDGTDAPAGAYIGSNGLLLDASGRLVIFEHGNGRVTQLDMGGKLAVLASKYEGKRLNSPNDGVFKSDGALYFTDPPYGFPKQDDDPKKELKFNGIFRIKAGKLELLSKELTRPNGIGFSPDEKVLYVSNSDPGKKIWMRFDMTAAGTLANGKVFFDATSNTAAGLPDGLKIDQNGNLFCTGPGGVWVFSPAGKHLGTISLAETPANLFFGGRDGKTLYITAQTGFYRMPVRTSGLRR